MALTDLIQACLGLIGSLLGICWVNWALFPMKT